MSDDSISAAAPGTEAKASVRRLEPADVPQVWDLLQEFAAFEKLEHLVTGSPEQLAANLFGQGWPRVEGFVASLGGTLAGYAIFYGGYSTFWTRPLLWLEDLYVPERFRGRGIGRSLFSAVARVAEERGCPHMDWAVLDWNTPAIEFYRGLGAGPNSGWHAYRLGTERLHAIATETKTS